MMVDPRLSQSATRLSEDIGDVLSAIRRMIAEDEALSSTRDRLRAERDALDSLIQSDTIHEDAGEFLARRYGGNAALARQLVHVPAQVSPPAAEENWPLGEDANAADAARPKRVLRHSEISRAAAIKALPDADGETAPLKLEQRVQPSDKAGETEDSPKTGGWRSWIRPEPRKSLDVTAKQAIEDAPKAAAQAFEELVEDDSAFAEAFDWKTRMRPELPTTAVSSDDPQPGPQPMAQVEDDVSAVVMPAEVSQVIDAEESVATDAPAVTEDPELRSLLREMIQEELQGEMGQRFSSNLRAVIRREVATMIDQHLERI